MNSEISYDLSLMSESEFKDSVCDRCVFEGSCTFWVYQDCTNAIHNRFVEFFYCSEFNGHVLRGST